MLLSEKDDLLINILRWHGYISITQYYLSELVNSTTILFSLSCICATETHETDYFGLFEGSEENASDYLHSFRINI